MLANSCKHRFLLSPSPAIPTPCGGVHQMKATNFAPLPHSDVKVVQKMKRIFVISQKQSTFAKQKGNLPNQLRSFPTTFVQPIK